MSRPEPDALFELPAKPEPKPAARRRTWARRLEEIEPIYPPGTPRPWDVIDAADQELGWEHRYVDHRRAVEIRHEVGRG